MPYFNVGLRFKLFIIRKDTYLIYLQLFFSTTKQLLENNMKTVDGQ